MPLAFLVHFQPAGASEEPQKYLRRVADQQSARRRQQRENVQKRLKG